MIWIAVWVILCFAALIIFSASLSRHDVKNMTPGDARTMVIYVPGMITALIWAIYYIYNQFV